ncbi:hypothetical protein [Hymenobacter cheonanensis]|uniref:hypothetical protein n=1 Tax=Hymenobacter sp. CA2-7 TaxID=3063993 RepID=UPI0027134AD2|nr:hypothetical protein [Hymenobacter sp. CA2-7]MDO7888061.1 hypothetical protein [Hymenobacter sp. CA2-7]
MLFGVLPGIFRLAVAGYESRVAVRDGLAKPLRKLQRGPLNDVSYRVNVVAEGPAAQPGRFQWDGPAARKRVKHAGHPVEKRLGGRVQLGFQTGYFGRWRVPVGVAVEGLFGRVQGLLVVVVVGQQGR